MKKLIIIYFIIAVIWGIGAIISGVSLHKKKGIPTGKILNIRDIIIFSILFFALFLCMCTDDEYTYLRVDIPLLIIIIYAIFITENKTMLQRSGMTQKEWGQVTWISICIGMWGAIFILLVVIILFGVGYLKSEKKKSDEQARKKELEGLLQKYEKANARERKELIEKIDQLNKDK